MPPRRRPQYTQEGIDQQLQQIHLLDASSSSENLEQLGPIIKQIHANRQQDVYLRNLQALVEAKDAEIETICTENYQEFISSVSTLFTIKSYTTTLREKIATLDESVAHLGKGLVEKKRTLVQSKKTAANLDEAIDTLQACLKLLDVVDRIGDMIKGGRFWSALRSLEDIQAMPLTSLAQTPLYQHLLSSLPSLRMQLQSAVTASMKQWLLEIRNVTGTVGKAAMEAMDVRARKWRSRREKDPMLRLSRVGSAVEMVTYERTDVNVLDSDKIQVDFQPLYQCIHIYSSLDSLDDLRTSYQADRKAQSDLILPTPLSLTSLPTLIEEICGFFIIESHVLETTSGFRSEREVEELWDAVVARLSSVIGSVLVEEKDPDTFLRVKEYLAAFVMTLESYSYSTHSLHCLTLVLFEKYAGLLESQFSQKLDGVVFRDDCLPMQVTTTPERDSVLSGVWLSASEQESLAKSAVPLSLPWSQSFYLCCQDIRNFIQKFYQFVEGVSQHHANIDDLLSRVRYSRFIARPYTDESFVSQSLDKLLSNHISDSINKRLQSTSALSQIAQIVTNLEYFEVACTELERSLTNLRSTQRGGTIRLASSPFSEPFQQSQRRITALITSKLDDFFDLSEYDWTPQGREETPSMYLYELVNWLTTVVDSLALKDTYKDEAYKGAVGYIAECLMNFMVGPNVPTINENAVANLVTDVTFLENEVIRIGREHLNSFFIELHSMAKIVLSDLVQDYLNPNIRHASYGKVKPKRLQALVEKLAKYGASRRDSPSKEKGEKRKREAEVLSRLSLTYLSV
ncbi:exocyst complex subunit Sec15-like protein [Gyrodon lividus]|nr:exocyst complex subunit Sec15-like protein [Gyrodon lividus]